MSYETHIASRTLEAAGAWYTAATPLQLIGNWRENRTNVARIPIIVTYTRGGAGGYPKLRVRWTVSDGAGGTLTPYDTTDSSTGTVADGALVVSNYRTEFEMIGFSDLATVETEPVMIDVLPSATHIKVECAEVGNVGAPGTIVVRIDPEL